MNKKQILDKLGLVTIEEYKALRSYGLDIIKLKNDKICTLKNKKDEYEFIANCHEQTINGLQDDIKKLNTNKKKIIFDRNLLMFVLLFSSFVNLMWLLK